MGILDEFMAAGLTFRQAVESAYAMHKAGVLPMPDVKWEHPEDWDMGEGPFAKQCSQLGYRLLSLADRTRNRALIPSEGEALLRINADLRAIGG